jgi:pimeloyl-ACP methyl ester carboxylesterase
MNTMNVKKSWMNRTSGELLRTLLLLFLFPALAFTADPPGIPDGWSDGFVYANGVRIHYYHAVPAPGKPVMVMVHGVTDNGLCWTTLTWKLQKDYDIYMLDTRGHGLSDPFTTSDNRETLIKDVVDFVKVMNFNKPILVGHSMGAATVMRVGGEYPELARSIIMLDPGIPRPGGAPRGPGATPPTRAASAPAANAAPTAPAAPRAAAPSAPAAPATRNLSISMNAAPEVLVRQNNYNFDELVETGKRQNPKWDIVDIKYWALSKKQFHGGYTPEGWQAMSGSMQTGDALAKMVVPSLILKADTSPEGRKANEDAVKDLTKVKLVHVDGAAHNLHHDDLERTYKEIISFLSTID